MCMLMPMEQEKKEAAMLSIFGRKIKEAREARGISGYRLAQLSGIVGPNLISIEKGRRIPSDENLRSLAAVSELGVSYEQLRAWASADNLLKRVSDAFEQFGEVSDDEARGHIRRIMRQYLGENQ